LGAGLAGTVFFAAAGLAAGFLAIVAFFAAGFFFFMGGTLAQRAASGQAHAPEIARYLP
jgi:hypothetical protein